MHALGPAQLPQPGVRHVVVEHRLLAQAFQVGEQMAAGGPLLSADYFGGFYSLSGCYPGATGQAVDTVQEAASRAARPSS